MDRIKRTVFDSIKADLREKMVFVGGPRQVGKTTLALQFLQPATKQHPAYLNWDIDTHRQRIRQGKLPLEHTLIVLDEVHKFKRWRRLLKGLYDEHYPSRNFLVTGSARLDHYRRGGDSLQGRYHYWRLHPFTLGELPLTALADLLHFGGFPEPFTQGTDKYWRRWNRERLDRIVREDLRDLEQVQDLSLIELLVDALPERVGSLLSYNALAENLEVSPRSVERWIRMLESLYVCFLVAPYGNSKIRAVKKAQKLYLWDWAAVQDPGARFENFVASHLLKYCHGLEDGEGYKMELRYLRDTAGREVDFVVLKDRKALFAVECKLSDKQKSKSIEYYKQRMDIPRIYQVHMGTQMYGKATHEGAVLPFTRFIEVLQNLQL